MYCITFGNFCICIQVSFCHKECYIHVMFYCLQVSSYSLGLDENLPSGTEVAVLEAFDRDSTPFNRFFFQFRSDGGPGMDAFSIDNITGRVTTSKVLDREQQEVSVMT